MRVCISAVMHTCDLDWGRAVLLMVCVLLMLKLRLWEEVRDWVGPIKSNRSAEAGAEAAAETGAGAGAEVTAAAEAPPDMCPKRSLLLLSLVWADAGIWPPGKAFHSPKSPLLLEAGAPGKKKHRNVQVYHPDTYVCTMSLVNSCKSQQIKVYQAHLNLSQQLRIKARGFSEASFALFREFSLTTGATF